MHPPIPSNEWSRLISLAKYDLDFSGKDERLQNLSKLAASIAGTEISLVNLIDAYTQWSVSSHGIDVQQMRREDSVCQYTLMESGSFEVVDLASDERFMDKFYVKEDPHLRYYYGVPLKNPEGYHLGALCVMGTEPRHLTANQQEQLTLIAEEIVGRLEEIREHNEIRLQFKELNEAHKKIAHDIRGPLSGIMGIAEIIQLQGEKNSIEEVLEFMGLIRNSSKSLLELSDEIMLYQNSTPQNKAQEGKTEFTLMTLKQKIEGLYSVQAVQKGVDFSVQIIGENIQIPFQKTKLLQLLGNLVSNAIKFTPEKGHVKVEMGLKEKATERYLEVLVEDTGVGISNARIQKLLAGQVDSQKGTQGEKGYGFGLNLVKFLVDSLHGNLKILSEEGSWTVFKVQLPLEIN